MNFKIVIPARYASSRLPGKALLDLGGAPMVVRVAKQAEKAAADEVIVATDHADVKSACEKYGVNAILTSNKHQSGTDRIAEVVELRGWSEHEIVINVQGDEPLIDPLLIQQAAAHLASSTADIATLAHQIDDAAELFNPNAVKVICDHNNTALYFSRAPIPYARDAFARQQDLLPPPPYLALRHIGLYAFRCSFLLAWSRLDPPPVEQFESLEQLRALWHGYSISVLQTSLKTPPGVDTIEDADKMQGIFDKIAR